jgi:penicillin-binding protein 1A
MKHKVLLITLLLVTALLSGIFLGGYVSVAKGIPSIAELKQYKALTGTRIFADDETIIGELKIEKGIFVPLGKMPRHLINAVIAVEDSRFWKHTGIDYIAIVRAAFKDIIHAGIKEGGSTITQQLAKITFLTPEKTVQRKIMEVALAMKIEKNMTKKEILELYLNRIYLGHGAYGMEMAARVYFGKSVEQLSLDESALLAGLIRAPAIYSPYNNLMKAKDRQETVLVRMEEEGYISRPEREKVSAHPITLSTLRRGLEANNYFIEYIRKYLEETYGLETVYKGNLSVYTTLDRRAQATAAKTLQDGLRDLEKRKGWRGPLEHKEIDAEKELKKKAPRQLVMNTGDIVPGIVLKVSPKEALIKARGVTGRLLLEDAAWAGRMLNRKTPKTSQIKGFSLDKILKAGDVVKVGIKASKGNSVELSLEQDPEAEGAIVAIDPHTGYIRAMVGGYDYSKSEYNRVVNARRQPGSAFKPIIYAAALDNGFTPASIINDDPVTYRGGTKGDWTPDNYDHRYYGPTRLRDALAYSRNIVTVKLVDMVGIDKVIEFGRMVGIEGDMPRNLSIALGSISVTPLELAKAYSVFAGGGVKMKPIVIKSVRDAKGMVIESNEPQGEQVINPETAFLITSMMEDVINYGTGWRVRALGRPAAGKTGTTNNNRDAWFIGYTPNLVACVWVGFDDMRPLGSQETGARAASPIWLNFMKGIASGDQVGFIIPEGITSYHIDPVNGLLSRSETSGLREFFKAGTQPREYSSIDHMRGELRETSKPDFD